MIGLIRLTLRGTLKAACDIGDPRQPGEARQALPFVGSAPLTSRVVSWALS